MTFSLFDAVQPALLALDPETAHLVSIRALQCGLHPRVATQTDPALAIRLWNLSFTNPFGMAAGFDKHAEVMGPLLSMGFGHVEVGSVTPLPQDGNPKPRVFRDAANRAVINRYGFPSVGLDVFIKRLRDYRNKPNTPSGIIGINLGKNKNSDVAGDDYVAGVRAAAPLADYLVINVSSPNTPGLRDLQGKDSLRDLLNRVKEERDISGYHPPLLLKIAPDLTEQDRNDIAEVVLETEIDGLIVSNTTTTRPAHLNPGFASQMGGLSGQPLFDLSTSALHAMYRLTQGKIPLIGVGGVANAQQAYAKIQAGASLVQLYSAMVYSGPSLIRTLNHDVAQLLRRDGHTSLATAIGSAHH